MRASDHVTPEQRDAIMARYFPHATGDKMAMVVVGVLLGELPPDPVLRPVCDRLLHGGFMRLRKRVCTVCGVRLMIR